ncbi:MAG: hypothetical protein GX308_07070 [Epulopiscium sp.]|nr:hypothetical protein [Candidatus Epulonipiscium sp.]
MSKCNISGRNLATLLADYIGETVTLFTASGGQSGSGFTGVVLCVNNSFIRLLTRVGPPPGCALGNACTGFNPGYGYSGYGGSYGGGYGAISAGGWNGYPVYTVGSVTDIPIDAIVSFVHNAI